jgi:hypothetical protein
MTSKLPPVALALLTQLGGVVDPARRATRAQLLATCKAQGFTMHASVAAFEAAYGGLVLDGWLFGAHACLASQAHAAPRGGGKARKLVPVAYSPNDVVYFLDEKGRGFAQDTIEETSATPYAVNGRALVTRILLHDALFNLQACSLELPGLRGAELAQRLSLGLVEEASGKDLRFFSDARATTIVVETLATKQTIVACADQERLRSIQAPSPASTGVPAELMGKPRVSMAAQALTELPDVFDRLPELGELDASSNRLETLPASLWRARGLKILDLGHNPLRALPEAIGDAKALRALSLRGCPLQTLPPALASAKHLEKLLLAECTELDVDAALAVIARLSKLKFLSLPLSRSLTTLAPLAQLPLRTLWLRGHYVELPQRLPAGLARLARLTDLSIEGADSVALLPHLPEDVRALRLLFHKRFKDDDIRKSARAQPAKLYLTAFANSL